MKENKFVHIKFMVVLRGVLPNNVRKNNHKAMHFPECNVIEGNRSMYPR